MYRKKKITKVKSSSDVSKQKVNNSSYVNINKEKKDIYKYKCSTRQLQVVNTNKSQMQQHSQIFDIRYKKLLATNANIKYVTEKNTEFNILFQQSLELFDNFYIDIEKRIYVSKKKMLLLMDTIIMLIWEYNTEESQHTIHPNFNHPIVFLLYKNGEIEKQWHCGYYDNLDICVKYTLELNVGDQIEFKINKKLSKYPLIVKKNSMILFQEFAKF